MKTRKNKLIKLTSIILTPAIITGVTLSLTSCFNNETSQQDNLKKILNEEKNRIDSLNLDLKPNLSQEEIKNINQNNLFDYLINAPINNDNFNYDVVDFQNTNNTISFKIKISKNNESIDSKLFSINITKPNPPQPPVVHKPTLINKDISAIKLNLNNKTIDEVLNNNLINPEFILQNKDQIFIGENNITDSNQIDVQVSKNDETSVKLLITLKGGSWYNQNGELSKDDSNYFECVINDFKQPVVPNPNQAQEELDKEVERINNSNIKPKNSTLTQKEFDQIDAANILDNLNLKLFLNDFDYSINPVDFKKENNSISFIIEVGVINSEWIGDPLPKRTKKITVDFIIDNNVVSRIDEVVEKLNKLNLSLSDKKIHDNNITYRDLTWNFSWGPEFILNNISEFNPNDNIVRDDFELKVPKQSFKHDILNQRITFIISVKEKQTNIEKDTIEKTINYTIPNQLIGQIDDQLPVDNDVKVLNSYKGTLQILKTKIQPYSEDWDNEIGSFNHNWKIKEYLYQLRFIFYQSFNDNAKSIDYGIVSYNNNIVTLELKAKIKNDANYSTIFQGLESKQHQISLKENDIVKITITKELSNKWEILNKGGDFGGLLDIGWSMTNGDFQSINNGLDKKFWVALQGKDLNINISINNSGLINETIPVVRRFPFLFPYKYK